MSDCNCTECRIRHAIHGSDPTAPFEVNTNEALMALGEVMAEMLAHHSTKTAKRFAAELLIARKKWQDHPRVKAQQPPAGHS